MTPDFTPLAESIRDSNKYNTANPYYTILEKTYKPAPRGCGQYDPERFPDLTTDYVWEIRREHQVFLSEQAAKHYLERASHHFNDNAKVIAASLNTPQRNTEMIQLREDILSHLPSQDEGEGDDDE